jgi:hypothetical protein
VSLRVEVDVVIGEEAGDADGPEVSIQARNVTEESRLEQSKRAGVDEAAAAGLITIEFLVKVGGGSSNLLTSPRPTLWLMANIRLLRAFPCQV